MFVLNHHLAIHHYTHYVEASRYRGKVIPNIATITLHEDTDHLERMI